MKLCRFKNQSGEIRVGLAVDDATLADLTSRGIQTITELLEDADCVARVEALANLPTVLLAEVALLTPVERQEVWAAGVTYLRSKTARNVVDSGAIALALSAPCKLPHGF